MINFLIEKGASVNTFAGAKHETPLHIVSVMDDIEFIEILIRNHAGINSVNINNETPLFLSISSKHQENALFLLKNHADPRIANTEQVTPLHIAAQWGDKKLLKALIQENANINAVDQDGYTPLIYSLMNKESDKGFKYLLKHHANPNIFYTNGILFLIKKLFLLKQLKIINLK